MTKPEKVSCADPKEIRAHFRKWGLTKHTLVDGDPRLGQGSAGGAREGVRDRRLVGLDAAPGAVAHEEAAFAAPPAFEPPQGSLAGCYSRRINRRHRLVYKMLREPHERNDNHCEGTVRILRMWTRHDGLEKESENREIGPHLSEVATPCYACIVAVSATMQA